MPPSTTRPQAQQASRRQASPTAETSTPTGTSAKKGYDRQYQELHGDHRMLSHRVTMLQKVIGSITGRRDLSGSDEELHKMHDELNDIFSSFRELKSEVEKNILLRAETAKLKEEVAQIKNKLHMDQGGQAELKAELEKNHSHLKNTVHHVKQAHDTLRQELEHASRELKASRDHTMARASRSEVTDVFNEVMCLKKELYDKGVLHPVREALPEMESHPPVGTLDLDEDVLTTRLLIRLGCMKAEKEAIVSSTSDECDSTEGASTWYLATYDDENVSGIRVPEFEEGGVAHWAATNGFAGICFCTMFLKYFIVWVLYKYGKDEGAGCVNHNLTSLAQFMLYASKALAILCSGVFMGTDLMQIANYWMVSELVEGRHNKEVIFCAVLRVGLALLLGFANVIIYNALASPALIFINMSVLQFVSQLGEMIIVTAKRGVFGHAISKTVTSLNYSLTFESQYPPWFRIVHHLTILGCVVFSSVFVWAALSEPVKVC